jgi:hypothetical protein
MQYEIAADSYEDMTRDEILDSINEDSGEIIDSCLPIYYSDMAALLAENINFGSVDDEGLLPENPTVWNIITTSVYEWLSSEFYTTAEEVLNELLPDLE